jgi:hypothetical protein
MVGAHPQLRDLRNGHNPDIAEAFMKQRQGSENRRPRRPSEGSVLALNAQEATERINGKPLLAEGVVDSIVDLTKKAGLKGTVVAIEPTASSRSPFGSRRSRLCCSWAEFSAHIRVQIPGVTWPGIISAICFALFFLGHYLAPGMQGTAVTVLRPSGKARFVALLSRIQG